MAVASLNVAIFVVFVTEIVVLPAQFCFCHGHNPDRQTHLSIFKWIEDRCLNRTDQIPFVVSDLACCDFVLYCVIHMTKNGNKYEMVIK